MSRLRFVSENSAKFPGWGCAINGIQVKVTFSKAVDRISAEKTANYTVTGLEGAKAVSGVQLLNEKEVLLTLGAALNNGSEYTVKASKEIKDAAGTKLGVDVETKTTLNDVTIPTVTEVKSLSTSQVQVTFSEPVKTLGASVNSSVEIFPVKADGTEDTALPHVAAATSSENGKVWIITLNAGSELKPGTKYNVYLNKDRQVVDYVGYVAAAAKVELSYSADVTVPQASSLDVLGQEYVIVKFNKPIKTFNASNVYWNVDGSESNNSNVGQSFEKIDATTFKVKFNLIPGGEKHFFVKGAEDFAGNVAPTAKFTKTIVDAITPAVSAIKLVDSDTFKVELNVEIADATTVFADDASTADKTKGRAFYPITDKDGNAVLVKSVEYGKKADGTDDHAVRLINVYNPLAQGNYTVKVTGLKDSLGRVLADKSEVINVANMPGLVAGATASAATGTQTKDQILLNINETTSASVSEESLLNTANWIVTTPVGTKSFAEVAGAKVTKVSSELYILEADKGAVRVTSQIQAVGLKTADGKTVAPFTATPVAATALDLGSNDFVASTTLTKKQVTIKVNGLLGNVNPADFRLFENNVDQTAKYVQSVTFANSTVKTANTSTITITLKEDLTLTNAYGLKVAASNIGTKDIFGNKLVANSGLILQDTTSAAISNAFVADADTAGNVIKVAFDKDVTASSLNKADFKVKTSKGTELTVDSVANTGDEYATITLDAGTDIPAGEEVTVEFKKNLSTALVTDGSVTTSSFRITGVSLDKGENPAIIEGDESMTITFNKAINPDVVAKIAAGDSGVTATAITTAFGALTGDTLFGTDPANTLEYDVDGNTVTITFSGLVAADTATAAPDAPLSFTPDADAELADGTTAIESVDGIPLILNLAAVDNINPAGLVVDKEINLQFAPNSDSFTVNNNFGGEYAENAAASILDDALVDLGDVNVTSDTDLTADAGVKTFTAEVLENNVIKLTATGKAAAVAADIPVELTITDEATGVTKTITATIKADAGTTVDRALTVVLSN